MRHRFKILAVPVLLGAMCATGCVKMVVHVAGENRLGCRFAAFRFFQPLETDARQERDCLLKITAQLRRIVVLIRPLVEVAFLVPLVDRYASGEGDDADKGG